LVTIITVLAMLLLVLQYLSVSERGCVTVAAVDELAGGNLLAHLIYKLAIVGDYYRSSYDTRLDSIPLPI